MEQANKLNGFYMKHPVDGNYIYLELAEGVLPDYLGTSEALARLANELGLDSHEVRYEETYVVAEYRHGFNISELSDIIVIMQAWAKVEEFRHNQKKTEEAEIVARAQDIVDALKSKFREEILNQLRFLISLWTSDTIVDDSFAYALELQVKELFKQLGLPNLQWLKSWNCPNCLSEDTLYRPDDSVIDVKCLSCNHEIHWCEMCLEPVLAGDFNHDCVGE